MTKFTNMLKKMTHPEMDDKTKVILQELAPYSADVLDPFLLNQKLSYSQIIKLYVLSVILLPLRIILVLSILSFAWVICKISRIGIPVEEDRGTEPLSGWRRHYVKPFIAELARLVFFVGGWYWIPHKGHRASPKEAPILLLMPHSSFLDTALVIALRCPGMVVKDSTEKVPFIGSLVKYAQPLFVKSEDPDCRRRVAQCILERVTSGKNFEQLLLFPEGGCGNREALLQFKLGAFAPGVPVQPVFIRYKNNLDTITWAWKGPSALKQFWQSFSQFRIYCQLEFLPVYRPSEVEKLNPRLFADNVRNFVCKWTGTPLSYFGVDDARYIVQAREAQLPATVAMVKLLKLRKALKRQDMDPAEEMLLIKQISMNCGNAQGDEEAMARYLGSDRCPEALREFFKLLDQHQVKILDFRIYLAGLCLLRTDIKENERIKAALQALGSENEIENLRAVFLLWKGIPASLCNFKYINSLGREDSTLRTVADSMYENNNSDMYYSAKRGL